MARPRMKIDPAQVKTLASIHCTYDEIAAVIGCSVDTLKRRFGPMIDSARDEGKASLRRMQFKKALEGNPTMLIWLGKQHLDQADEQRIKIGNLNDLTDEQLADLAAGKPPVALVR